MVRNSEIHDDEVNLVELVKAVWEGKWKIFLITTILLLITYSLQSNKKDIFNAKTEVRPISSTQASKYLSLKNIRINNFSYSSITDNSFLVAEDFFFDEKNEISFDISNKRLFEIFVEVLNERSLFEEVIRKYNIIDAKQYSNDQQYNEAIIKFASSIKIIPSTYTKENKIINEIDLSPVVIETEYDNVKKWKNFLIQVNSLANEAVKNSLLSQYSFILSSAKKRRKFFLEDIAIKIDNLKVDYERKTFDRLTYLMEQSKIAKELGIAKNTIEVQNFGNQNALLSNVKTDSPFYLRGYEAIDKEVELIKSRTDLSKKAFIKGLLNLEQIQRNTIQDKSLERTELNFLSSALNKEGFIAATINVYGTKYKFIDNTRILLLTLISGLTIGIFYVLFSNAINISNRKKR